MSFDLEKHLKLRRKRMRSITSTYQCYFDVIANDTEYCDEAKEMDCYGDLWEMCDVAVDKGYETSMRVFVYIPGDFKNDVWWYDFVLNRSFFRDVFLTKDPKDSVVEINLKRPYTEILAGLIFHRRPREVYPPSMQGFFTKGLTEIESFILSEVFYCSEADNQLSLRVYDSDHNLTYQKTNLDKLRDIDCIHSDQAPYTFFSRGTVNLVTAFTGQQPSNIRKAIKEWGNIHLSEKRTVWEKVHECVTYTQEIEDSLVELMKGLR